MLSMRGGRTRSPDPPALRGRRPMAAVIAGRAPAPVRYVLRDVVRDFRRGFWRPVIAPIRSEADAAAPDRVVAKDYGEKDRHDNAEKDPTTAGEGERQH